MDDTARDKCAIGYLWSYVGDGKLAVFEYIDSRLREGPTDFLCGFKESYLMSDGYAGYSIAIGRKKYLSAASPEGAHRLAIIYSLVATCKLNGINQYEYFVDILPKIASYPASTIADLTPINWKKNRMKK